MTTFLQLHLLTAYPPACLNRDDLNRPKTAVMGGVPRLRVSSQSLKRAWRTSDIFQEAVAGQTGIRSKELGRLVRDALLSGASLAELLGPNAPGTDSDDKVPEPKAAEWAWMIAAEYVDKKGKGGNEGDDEGAQPDDGEEGKKGKKKAARSNVGKETLKSEQVVFYSKDEIKALDELIVILRENGKAPTAEQLKTIKVEDAGGAADLALFGRMLASSPKFNVEAACQVAHAITVHRAAVEDDFFTAVDDLNTREEDAGSAHMGEQGFGAGLFYSYICVNCDALRAQLGDELAGKTIQALTEAAATVAPTGKQNSFASRAWAYYALAEKGGRQPRALSLAFMKPVNDYGDGMLANAVQALESMRDNLDQVYYDGQSLASRKLLALPDKAEGSFKDLLDFAADCGGV
ncbi:type I-E CRISPR-associated protein Cas7/Cse4/CasC [Acidithiobacillus sulfuriphilus]|uniref:Type I-E CRISPR-associated protein Cas7/Cse4/CasC n=2 Tax=Acidithiobacillus sulfuriphilus TaxID=1867749 RepID=A0A3M8QV21_9PROT|nr:type I-E CRISPR-associated protein Cas7/Cse4/CasC [Acidithiobacillus sulfuriphilus]RNF59322.1 type I-E CRISPR-associated protein Cas7/Cse4/CasC [Acidithiobacillus sulfuriphilus]